MGSVRETIGVVVRLREPLQLRAKIYDASWTKFPNWEGACQVSIAGACPGVSTHAGLTSASVSHYIACSSTTNKAR
jgi:hypothetical protein